MRLSVEDLGYRYGRGAPVLEHVTFEVPSGSTAALLGPSGSGKTTLISILGGLLPAQTGQFGCIDENGVRHLPRSVSTWVLQTVSLLPHRTVLDNVCLGSYLDGASVEVATERARSIVERVGLAGRERDRAAVMSGGEAQRVAIARALASRRPILFADEPTGQLDRATTTSVLDTMFEVSDRTIILVTHDETAAARCDSVFRLVDGRVVQE